MAEQNRNYLSLPHGCGGSREWSSQGQMFACKDKGHGNVPIWCCAVDLSQNRVFPLFPHSLSWGGEPPSRNCRLKAKTQQLVNCFEGDKPWWPALVMLVTGVRHKWSVQDLLPPRHCFPWFYLRLSVCVHPSRHSCCKGALMASGQAAWNQTLRFHL